jgi:hypothetical protein
MPKRKSKTTSKGIRQGFYIPRNPEKYRGDPTKIIYRSSWEYRVCARFDISKNVVEWASEEFFIPYYDPSRKRNRRYFPDFWYKTADGQIVVVEVKPYKETQPPVPSKRKKPQTMINESTTYATNLAKWDAARAFCEKRGWKFEFVTEHDLGLTK